MPFFFWFSTLESKIKIWDMCVLPQTWALTKSQVEELRVTRRAMERSIFRIRKKDEITNENSEIGRK